MCNFFNYNFIGSDFEVSSDLTYTVKCKRLAENLPNFIYLFYAVRKKLVQVRGFSYEKENGNND